MPEGESSKWRARWNWLLWLLRWEEPVVLESEFAPAEVMERINALLPPTTGWMRFFSFGATWPLDGDVVAYRGLIRSRNRFAAASNRRLRFSVEPNAGGSRLQGNFELVTWMWLYEVFCLTGAISLEATFVYHIVSATSIPPLRAFLDLLRPLLVLPFVWAYVRVGLWWTRKHEAELLTILGRALSRSAAASIPAGRRASPSSPTEIFIRPRPRSGVDPPKC
jgi:hypothetical protein